ncbi:MAG: sulfur carrier protein ThiS [Campylobacterales bacterium]
MIVIVNGEEKVVPEGTTLLGLMQMLGVEEKVMAAAVNMQIVKKEAWKERLLVDGEKVELLQFTGGG